MNKYLYKIKDLEIPTHLKYWIARKSKINFDLSEILNGSSFDLTNTVNKKLHLINIFGNSIQNGEPTPENPIEIKSSGDNGHIVEKFVNKNVFGFNRTFDTSMSGLRIKCTDNENITFKGTATSDYLKTIELTLNSPLEANTEYYASELSNIQSPTRFKMWGYDKNHTMVVNQILNGKFTPSKDVISIVIKLENMSIGTTYDIEAKFQIEKGSVKTDYEPHQEQVFTIPCQQPMRAIGDVKDTFVKIEGVWYERHYINRLILRGTQNWCASSSQVVDRYYMNLSDGKILDDYRPQVSYCNYYNYNYNAGEVGAFYLGSYQSTTRVFINYAEKDTSTIQDFKDFLEEKFTQGKPVYADYTLKEPLDLPCTQAQITPLEALQKARTYKNVTHIYSEDEVPANLEIQYYKEKGE